MKAIAITRGSDTPRMIELPRPEPSAGEALVRTLRVGVDGTDHEVIEGGHGGFPEGEEFLVLGHEAVGVVEDPNGTSFEAIGSLAPGGVLALLGLPEPLTFEVDGGSIHEDIVTNNEAVVGSVNSAKRHFRRATDRIASFPDWFLDVFVTGVHPAPSSRRRSWTTKQA